MVCIFAALSVYFLMRSQPPPPPLPERRIMARTNDMGRGGGGQIVEEDWVTVQGRGREPTEDDPRSSGHSPRRQSRGTTNTAEATRTGPKARRAATTQRNL